MNDVHANDINSLSERMMASHNNVDNSTMPVTIEPVAVNLTHSYYYAGGAGLDAFYVFYKQYHGYLASCVCVFGIIANILNIVVLTRKNMVSATNCILTGLAVSDGLTMVAYLPFALRFYCLYGTEPTLERNTLEAIRFMLFYACFSVVVHTVSIWLTVTLAVFRYIFVRYPRYGSTLCTLQRAKIAVFLNYIVTLIVCVPNFVTIGVQRDDPPEGAGNTTDVVYMVGYKRETANDRIMYKLNFWVQALLVKFVPCVGLTILSLLLVNTMNKAEKHRKNLKMKPIKGSNSADKDSGRERKTNRTTRMLLVVVFLFLLTEFPQGILTLLSGILPNFADEVYGPLGDLVDILALINNGVNFILYCSMSKQFRDTFINLFVSPCCRKNNRFTLVPTTMRSEV